MMKYKIVRNLSKLSRNYFGHAVQISRGISWAYNLNRQINIFKGLATREGGLITHILNCVHIMMNFSTKMITFMLSSTKVKTNFYVNGKIINKYTFYTRNISEEQKIVSFWKQLSPDNEIEFIDEDMITTMGQVFVATEMSTQNITQFTQEILNYCKENLAKVEAFIPSPFVSKYLLTEVNLILI